jgi:ribonuclease E
MTKRMLIDATHAEETRVVVLDGNRLEDFDVEAATKKQLKGNIYLAKVVRVEPSLQAAFVEYGGGRHGFLAFGEIHPDYYQIPVADRQRLLKMQAEEAAAEAADEDDDDAPAPAAPLAAEAAPAKGGRRRGRGRPPREEARAAPLDAAAPATAYGELDFGEITHGELVIDGIAEAAADMAEAAAETMADAADMAEAADQADADEDQSGEIETDETPPEEVGGDSDVFEGNGAEEAAARRSARFLRNFRIQEVIRRRQILLIQVVKEERGTKGAALTTYISLAGRFCVLMPNSPRGGGISRKITSAADRRRLKEITAELEVPQGMGLIVRTAGAARPKPEIRRDCEYLMRLWDDIRETTFRSIAPALIYEEANLIKRTIRDGYSRDIDEVVVDGEAGWRAARDFMRQLMPAHARKVQLWRPEGGPGGAGQPLFAKHGVEDQLDSMLVPTVQLKSGGYLVINQAEALVAIDVNSGRSTRERGIEETALRTNLEAAEEAARQLRLRDLAGLIVIDFIDMESKKHNAMVERRLKEALKNDRARIQVGQISHFGLLEMSRQRLRPSLTETSFITCPHCAGLGLVRNVESSAIHVLRQIEEEGAKARAGHIMVHVANAVAMCILNTKRERLAEIEQRYAMRVHFNGDDTLPAPQTRIDRLRPPLTDAERAILLPAAAAPAALPAYDLDEDDRAEDTPDDDDFAPDVAEAAPAPAAVPAAPAPRAEPPAEAAADGDTDERGRRRRRRRRGGRREDGEDRTDADGTETDGTETDGAETAAADTTTAAAASDAPLAADAMGASEAPQPEPALAAELAIELPPDPAQQDQPSLDPEEMDENGLPKARRRGRRGGRRRRRDEAPEAGEDAAAAEALPAEATQAEAIEPPTPLAAPAYTGPTPANPFGGQALDIFDILEQAELARTAPAPRAPAPPAELAIPPVPPDATAPGDILAEPAAIEAAPVEAAPVEAAPVEAAPVEAAPTMEVVIEAPASVAAPPPEPAAEPAAPVVGPAIKPVVLGADPLPATPPKRGWWKR